MRQGAGLKPGDRIDRYVIEALLGEGGMGAVYRAHDERLRRRVALKVVRSGALHDPQADSRMLKEARAAAALDHPNAISIFDVAPFEGGMYIAMELIEGRSLRSFVGDSTVPLEERIRWLTDVAKALGAAHRRGIIHRDIKPENIMIREDGVVKVLDFGIARRLPAADGAATSTATGAGVVAGTPLYMAHTQAWLYLGIARAASGDSRGACEAWQAVLGRWGMARPGSRTAQEARRRIKDAGCTPSP